MLHSRPDDPGRRAHAGMLIFTLVILPVEREANKRTLEGLERSGLIAGDETKGVRSVLKSITFN